MLHRMAHVLLAAVLASSGATASFRHVHAHAHEHGASPSHGGRTDAHCAHHDAEGAHWHPSGSPARDAGGVLAPTVPAHGHAAVTVSAAAIETAPVDAGASCFPVDAPQTRTATSVAGERAPVASDAGPDPPPRAANAARAPPVRS